MPTFVLNDESIINSHGFVLLNRGAKTERFMSNPVMLDSHDSNKVIGRWNNLKFENGKITAEAEFDTQDPDAAKIAGKVERGFIKGASMGIMINDADIVDLPIHGLTVAITDWELLEASTCGVPSNKNALKLYSSDGKTLLDAKEAKLSIDELLNKKNQNMPKEIKLSVDAARVLGLTVEPDSTELSAAIMELSASLASANDAKEKAEKELNDHRAKLAVELVDEAIKEGKLTADRKDSFVKLATEDYKQAKDILDAMPGKQSFSKDAKPISGNERAEWDYMRWLKEDPKGLTAMRANEPKRFEQLKANYKR